MDVLSNMAAFIGRFHPVLVHLPIGMLLLGAIFLVLTRRNRYSALAGALPLTFLLGGLAAGVACLTGWLLGGGGDYDATTLDRHRWLGIGLTLASAVVYAWLRRGGYPRWRLPLAAGMFGLLTATGHLGGTLTHGSGYLAPPFAREGNTGDGPLIVAGKVQEAQVYGDLVGPLLNRKCGGCHGSSRQKGRLRLDTPKGILQGGKNGAVLVAGQPEHSELCRRLELDLLHEEHMPPKGKPQLKEAERILLQWWIRTGAGFEGRVDERTQTEAVAAALRSFEAGAGSEPTPPDVPEEPAPEARASDLQALRAIGATVFPVGRNRRYLSVNFVNAPRTGDAELALLLPLARQIVWLKLGDTRVTDAGLATVAGLPRLTRLGLERTAVSDAGLGQLQDLDDLRYLNLSGTAVTADGIRALRQLSRLRTVYLYHSGVAAADLPALQAALPGVVFELGGYALPVLESDTLAVSGKTVK